MLHSGSVSNYDTGVVYATPRVTSAIPIKSIEHLGREICENVANAGQYVSINVRINAAYLPRRSILLRSLQAFSLPKTFTGTFLFIGSPELKQLSAEYTPSFHFNVNNSAASLQEIHSILTKKGKLVKQNPKPEEIVAKTVFSATFALQRPTHVETYKKSKAFGSCVVYDNYYVPIVGIVTELGASQFELGDWFKREVTAQQHQSLSVGRLTKGAG